jgi:hypothetical protein
MIWESIHNSKTYAVAALMSRRRADQDLKVRL